MAVWGGLTNSCEKSSKKQRRKGRYTHLNAEFQRIARRDKKAFLSDQYKDTDENNRIGKNREILYSEQKQDLELTVAQIMISSLQNSGFKLKKLGKTTRPYR